ncbi:caspase family protein [Streptomyces sp. NPDC005931]|uniref:caspase, EACC1-associated type n=1 Tax=Streptomyces sp. NPDC005931 TaxID=3364737 RepID=UPI00367F85B6
MSAGRFALLVATGRYDSPDLRRLRSPAHDAHGLARVLEDPRIGDFEVDMVVDGRQHEVTRAVEGFFRDRRRDDLLLLHLSCHGIKDDDGELHFATIDTDRELLASTSVPAAFLHTQMRRCRARSIVLLLDCCYSGAFLPGAKGDTAVHVRDGLAGHGRAVLTATNRTEYAWEGERLDELDPRPSRFTGAVISGLASGEADRDRDGMISVHDLYDHVYESLQTGGPGQRPQMWAELEHRVVIARSVQHPPPTAPLPATDTRPGPPPTVPRPPPAVPRPAPSRAATPAPPGPRGGDRSHGMRLLLPLTEALTGLSCMATPPGRAQFATVLGEELDRRVDLRGVGLREDVVTIVRAALNREGGLRTLLWTVALFEGRRAAVGVQDLLDPDDRSPHPPPSMRPLLELTDGLSGLPCVADAAGRTHFAGFLAEQLDRRIDLRGVGLREDVVTIVRAALDVERGAHLLVRVVEVFEGPNAADEFDRLVLAIGSGTGH